MTAYHQSNQPRYVFGLLLDSAANKTFVVIVWRTKIYKWTQSVIEIENGLKYAKGMLVGYNTFGYCGYNTEDNSIVAGHIVLDMEKGELRK